MLSAVFVLVSVLALALLYSLQEKRMLLKRMLIWSALVATIVFVFVPDTSRTRTSKASNYVVFRGDNGNSLVLVGETYYDLSKLQLKELESNKGLERKELVNYFGNGLGNLIYVGREELRWVNQHE